MITENPTINPQVSFEEPPEYFIEGATSIPVVRASENDEFAEAIKVALKADADELYIGEAKDKDAVEAMMRLSSAGCVVTTTHP
ncbi:hypothetical protein VCHA53O466_50262 [Vibrio chagasii]|nr:hypothetical protein VCHA53O466_50262 [Vibrio chagasii]